MAQRKKNKQADAAMEIADMFKEIKDLARLMRTKIMEADTLMEKEPTVPHCATASLAFTAEFIESRAAQRQAQWHNMAFERGYFETVEGLKKLSKTPTITQQE